MDNKLNSMEHEVRTFAPLVLPRLVKEMENMERSEMKGAAKKKYVIEQMEKFLAESLLSVETKAYIQFYGFFFLPHMIDTIAAASNSQYYINSPMACCGR